MICYRFESFSQSFPLEEGEAASFPLAELLKHKELIDEYEGRLAAEIPAIIYPGREASVQEALEELFRAGLKYALCENIGAVEMCRRAGLTPVGGMFLNVLNSGAAEVYASMGLAALTLSMELRFSDVRKLKMSVPFGITVYGYLPLMKLRACPVKAQLGCRECSGLSSLTDRMGESFPVICRGREYSELLNCVPLYLGDKSVPPADFYVLYFTIESREEALRVSRIFKAHEAPDFRRTNGLYYRELL